MSDTYPIYRKLKDDDLVVKFIDTSKGYVIRQGSSYDEVGSLRTNWRRYNDDCWEPYDYVDSDAITTTKTPDQLELFESMSISSSSTITKVPNGYVMTSYSGHQILIPSNSI